MTDQQHGDESDDPKRPSQAEGERTTVEQSLNERSDKARHEERDRVGERTNDPERPSQAEGERDVGDQTNKKH